ncbi:MAG: hypothetical protein ACYDEJ_07555 [Desulfitobacteriaceae bacterium]
MLFQSLQGYKQHRNLQLPVYSPEMEQLFYEFLHRYQEWSKVKRQENLLFIGLVIVGMIAFFYLCKFPQIDIVYSFLWLFFFCILIVFFQKVSLSVNHQGINTRIVYHHLIGKLEVGFCQHHQPCSCVEDFRQYVLKNYYISLYGDSFD